MLGLVCDPDMFGSEEDLIEIARRCRDAGGSKAEAPEEPLAGPAPSLLLSSAVKEPAKKAPVAEASGKGMYDQFNLACKTGSSWESVW